MTTMARARIQMVVIAGACLVASSASNAAPDPTVQLGKAIQKCEAVLASRAPKVFPATNGGYSKSQEIDAFYELFPVSTVPSSNPVAGVRISTTLAVVSAPSEKEVKDLPLTSAAPFTTRFVRRYEFKWVDEHWSLINATINLSLKAPGMLSMPMKDKSMELEAARSGGDSGPSCIKIIEAS